MAFERLKDGPVGTSRVVLRRKGTSHRNKTRISGKDSIDPRCYVKPSYVLLLTDARNTWYRGMVIDYNASDIRIIQEKKGSTIRAEGNAQPVHSYDRYLPP